MKQVLKRFMLITVICLIFAMVTACSKKSSDDASVTQPVADSDTTSANDAAVVEENTEDAENGNESAKLRKKLRKKYQILR